MSKVREVTINVTCKTETALSTKEIVDVIESLFNDYDILNITVKGDHERFNLHFSWRMSRVKYLG